jgi:hypothetical protein
MISQKLDYLGIPFRCSICRRTGHLRRDCSKFPPPEALLDPAEEANFNGYISSPNLPVDDPSFHRDDTAPEDDLVSKIQSLCPSLYSTFSASDRLYISEHSDLILSPTPSPTPTDLPLDSPVPDSIHPTASIPPNVQVSLNTLPTPPTQLISEIDPLNTLNDISEPNPLAGFAEPPLSDTQLDSIIRDLPTDSTLPFESLPLHTYHGNSTTVGLGRTADNTSSSRLFPSTFPDPTWSRGVGQELSPLKTRSARKKILTGSTSADSSTPVPTPVALRGLKALA